MIFCSNRSLVFKGQNEKGKYRKTYYYNQSQKVAVNFFFVISCREETKPKNSMTTVTTINDRKIKCCIAIAFDKH